MKIFGTHCATVISWQQRNFVSPRLKKYIMEKLELRWSPEQIAMRLQEEFPAFFGRHFRGIVKPGKCPKTFMVVNDCVNFFYNPLLLVVPRGIEPRYQVPETCVLSIVLRDPPKLQS